MSYHTVNELEHFDFAGAQVYSIEERGTQLFLQLGYVTIKGDNSCNRDVRDMGTNELSLRLKGVARMELIREGYKVFDADGNPKADCADEIIAKQKYKEVFQELENGSIYALIKEDREYRFYFDTEDRTYTLSVQAEEDTQQWERFMNKTPSY